jgi:hypothetical protein
MASPLLTQVLQVSTSAVSCGCRNELCLTSLRQQTRTHQIQRQLCPEMMHLQQPAMAVHQVEHLLNKCCCALSGRRQHIATCHYCPGSNQEAHTNTAKLCI